jgi:hypothetical protein
MGQDHIEAPFYFNTKAPITDFLKVIQNQM